MNAATQTPIDWQNFIQDSCEWSRKNTPGPSLERKSSSSGSRLFSTGNSGSLLRLAVLKQGPGCREEGQHCETLGSGVAPLVYGFVEDGYVMECLEPAPRPVGLLRHMESLLTMRVWNRPALPITPRWRDHVEFLGVDVPDWVEPTELTLAHGDCTASNAMLRGGTLIIADPRPPRVYVPQCPETDIGRLLQSAMGWESVAYGLPFQVYEPPVAWVVFPERQPKYLFWCGMAITRVLAKEKAEQQRPHVIAWCERSREVCFDSIGVRSR